VNLIGQKKLTNICMGKLFMIMTEVFLDTSFAIALSFVTDQNHARAIELANQIESNSTRLVITRKFLPPLKPKPLPILKSRFYLKQ
jgi:uncharacterized protein